MENQTLVSVDLIDHNPYQPRHTEDADLVAEVAQSIKHNGLMQVPSARQVNGRYELAFGHTRLAAFQLNGEECMPLIVRELDDLQMFELGVAENIKRRDLNPVEQAEAMQLYMDKFGKTSVEAGEFFNVSEEQVRGTVRFNDLAEPVKEKLAKGNITVTTARTFLSMQKVAPEAVIVETLKRLEKGTDRWGMQERPDEAIEEIMGSLDEVKELWSRDGKPRGGRHDAWLLDMKNFPNKFLPVLTLVDAAIALGIQNEEEMMRKVSTWVEASLGELPDLDTETLGIPEPLLAMLDHLITPPACTACPFHTVVQKTHYCGMETCFNRKTRAWSYEQLRAASKDLKIQIYNAETDGEFRVLEETYSDTGKKHAELFRKRSKDLRIALAVDIDRKKSQYGYSGVPSAAVVMLVGPTLKNLLATGQKERAEKRSTQNAAELLEKLLKLHRDALNWEATRHIKTVFDGLNLEALEILWETPGRYGWELGERNTPEGAQPEDDAKDEVKADFQRRLLSLNMINKADDLDAEYEDTVSSYADWLTGTAKSWDVKLPKSILKMAVQADEEIATVTAETEKA